MFYSVEKQYIKSILWVSISGWSKHNSFCYVQMATVFKKPLAFWPLLKVNSNWPYKFLPNHPPALLLLLSGLTLCRDLSGAATTSCPAVFIYKLDFSRHHFFLLVCNLSSWIWLPRDISICSHSLSSNSCASIALIISKCSRLPETQQNIYSSTWLHKLKSTCTLS